jgi:beta-lactamase regulating signal transducer with metallopeptidase domain
MIGAMMDSLILPVAQELGTDIILKATVVMSVSTLLTFALRQSSSATRHTIWSTAFVILIVLPVVSTLFPSWHMGWAGPPRHDAFSNGKASVVAQVQAADRVTPGKTDVAPAAAPVEQRPAPMWSITTAAAILVVIWLCGAVASLLRLLVHVLRVGRISARAREGNSRDIHDLAVSLIESLGIRRPVRIVMSDEVTMPFAWGVFKPVIIFPAAAEDWPVARKRSVLLHELAHVARSDYAMHIVAEIVQALYWPNPMVWLAARQKATERERACDDFALREGTPSREYASHLLDIARLQIEPCIPVGAVNMSAKTVLVDRIHYVLDKQLNRSPASSDRLMLASVAVLCISLPLGAIDVSASKWAIPKTGQLITELQSEVDPAARRRAAWWLGEHEAGRSVGPLIDGLRDESADVRIASAWALGEIKDKKAIAPLVEALERDDDPLVREMAALALGEIEDPSAVDPLAEAFENEADVRLAVVWALGEIEGNGSREAGEARDEAVDAMQIRSRDNDEVWTGELSGHRPDSDDVPALLRRLSGDDSRERRDAALSLGFIGASHDYESTAEIVSVVDALLSTLRDPAPEVRAAAVWSLDEINPSRSARKH